MTPDTELSSTGNVQLSVTIAIIELAGGKSLERCISGAIAEAKATRSEVLVACRAGTTLSTETFQYDKLNIINNAGDTVPERRLMAARASKADIVAMIEDTTLPPKHWGELLKQSFSDLTVGAVSGPIAISHDLPAQYRALGFMDYGRFGGDQPSGGSLPGNCMAFHKSYLLSVIDDSATGIMEQAVSDRLVETGKRICFNPKIIAEYAARDPNNSRLAMQFHHGRVYASDRYSDASISTKLFGFFRALLVPPVLFSRGAGYVFKRSSPSDWPANIVWIGLMSVSIAAGECVGAILGPGDSASKWH